MNLLFAINQKITDLLCSCIRSIVKYGGADHYNAYILHSDLQAEDKTRIALTAGECMTCHYITVDESIFDGFPESNRYPRQIYYRLAAPLLLPGELERILYLDVDLVVINSLVELYHTDFEGNFYVACSHVKEFLTKFNQLRLGVATSFRIVPCNSFFAFFDLQFAILSPKQKSPKISQKLPRNFPQKKAIFGEIKY